MVAAYSTNSNVMLRNLACQSEAPHKSHAEHSHSHLEEGTGSSPAKDGWLMQETWHEPDVQALGTKPNNELRNAVETEATPCAKGAVQHVKVSGAGTAATPQKEQ